jgi:hypothetical protein
MSDVPLTSPRRRGFFGRIAAAAAALGLGDIVPAAQAAESGGTEFQVWLDGIRGQYRQVYDTPSLNNGLAHLVTRF